MTQKNRFENFLNFIKDMKETKYDKVLEEHKKLLKKNEEDFKTRTRYINQNPLILDNEYLVYEKKCTKLVGLKPEEQVCLEYKHNFIGYLYKIRLLCDKINIKHNGEDNLTITAKVYNHLGEEVEKKFKILFLYDDIIYERETDDKGECFFKVSTRFKDRINICTVNSNMLNSNITIDAK